MKATMKVTITAMVLSVTLLLIGCTDQGPVKRSWGKMKGLEKVVGNMRDVSYSEGRTQEPRLNAQNQPVHMTDFEGSYVWAEYSAPWCQPCAWQAPRMKEVESQHPEMIFLTIMTSNSTTYNDHATVKTAQQWSSRFSLDPTRVIAANLWYKTIPEHRFYSPEGHTLFVHVGAMTVAQINEVISYYQSGYETWKESGDPAKWMTFR